MKTPSRKLLTGCCVFLFWFTVWGVAAKIVGSELLLPGPFQVIRRLAELAGTAAFRLSIGFSILRMLGGILSGVILGILLAVLTEKSRLAAALVSPVMTVVKSTPVAAFIFLALLWIGRDILPAFISCLMVLPVMWANISAGIAGIDPSLMELARVYRFSRRKTLRLIIFPSVFPHFRAALCSVLGLGWKAGVAAEVLTVPARSVGKMIYESKLYLETTDLFAWTLTIILLSLVFEKLLLQLIRRIGREEHRDDA